MRKVCDSLVKLINAFEPLLGASKPRRHRYDNFFYNIYIISLKLSALLSDETCSAVFFTVQS